MRGVAAKPTLDLEMRTHLPPTQTMQRTPRTHEFTRDSVVVMSSGTIPDRLVDYATAYRAAARSHEALGDMPAAQVHHGIANVFNGALAERHEISTQRGESLLQECSSFGCFDNYYESPIDAKLALALFEHAIVKTLTTHPSALHPQIEIADRTASHKAAWQKFENSQGKQLHADLCREYEHETIHAQHRVGVAAAIPASGTACASVMASLHASGSSAIATAACGPVAIAVPAIVSAYAAYYSGFAAARAVHAPTMVAERPDLGPLIAAHRSRLAAPPSP